MTPPSFAQRRYMQAAPMGLPGPRKPMVQPGPPGGVVGPKPPMAMAHGGECYACGGMVDEHGYAFGGEVEAEYSPSDNEFKNAIDEARYAPADDGGDDEKPSRANDDEEDEDSTIKAKFAAAIKRRK